MKGRLIQDDQGAIWFLSANGERVPSSYTLLQTLLLDFSQIDQKSWGSDACWNNEYITDMMLYPGETLAFISDTNQLVVCNSAPFRSLLSQNKNADTPVRVLSASEYGKKHNKGKEIIKYFCREGRIAGAYKINGYWMIPEDAPYPIDIRQQRSSDKPRSGRPKKNRTAPLLDKDQH